MDTAFWVTTRKWHAMFGTNSEHINERATTVRRVTGSAGCRPNVDAYSSVTAAGSPWVYQSTTTTTITITSRHRYDKMAAVRCSTDNEVSRRCHSQRRYIRTRKYNLPNPTAECPRAGFVFSSSVGRTSSFAVRFVFRENGQKITSIVTQSTYKWRRAKRSQHSQQQKRSYLHSSPRPSLPRTARSTPQPPPRAVRLK